MRILVACEYSGTVREAFIKKGHDAISCDLLPTESHSPHYQGDVRDILYDNWDLVIKCVFAFKNYIKFYQKKRFIKPKIKEN